MKAQTIKVAIIPADEDQPVEFKEIENTLAAKREIVDGPIEAVRLLDTADSVAMDYYCNDEFLLRDDMEFNRRATALYVMSFYAAGHIRGDVVVIGGVDDHGDDIGLTTAQENHLKALFHG